MRAYDQSFCCSESYMIEKWRGRGRGRGRKYVSWKLAFFSLYDFLKLGRDVDPISGWKKREIMEWGEWCPLISLPWSVLQLPKRFYRVDKHVPNRPFFYNFACFSFCSLFIYFLLFPPVLSFAYIPCFRLGLLTFCFSVIGSKSPCKELKGMLIPCFRGFKYSY